MLISLSHNSEAGNGLWASSGSPSSFFSNLNVLSTSAFLLLVHLIFVFVLFSFLIFFGKMYLKKSSFVSPFLFYQLRVNDKIEIGRQNRLFIFAFQQMHISIGARRRKIKCLFFTKTNTKKSISNGFFTKQLSSILSP